MTLARRALLRAIGGASVLAPAVSPKDALGLIGSGASGLPLPDAPDQPMPSPVAHNYPDPWRCAQKIFERSRFEREVNRGLHPAITGKRSWSPAYKAHVHAEMVMEEQAVLDALHKDDALTMRIAKFLGMTP